MKLACSQCRKDFDFPGEVAPAGMVLCPDCGQGRVAGQAATVPYSAASDPALSPPDGERRPERLGDEEILSPGTLLGQYRLEGLLGRGGMGTVYKARHTMLDRTVALKVLPPKFAADPEFINRFKREALALANLSHPHIVAIHDMGVQGSIYFFVMEYVDGVNLRDLLSHKKLPADQALKIVPQLCEALEYAHSKGIIHRDIKPANILIDRAGVAKVADFGLAKIVKGEGVSVPLTQTNVVMGTVEYMAPEQRDSLKAVDHRADIYSMGVVLYELLTGELPVGKFDLPSKCVQVHVRIDDVVLKALERDPEQRYQRASQMGTDVGDVITGVVPPKPGPVPLNLQTVKDVARGLDPKQVERVGVYAIVNAALLLVSIFTGLIFLWVCVAVFWGMAIALDFWKAHLRAKSGVPAASPTGEVAASPPPKPSTSIIAVLALLASLGCMLAVCGASVAVLVERGLDETRVRNFDVDLSRGTAFVLSSIAIVLGTAALGLFLAAGRHLRESKGRLKGRPAVAVSLLFLAIGAGGFFGYVKPHLARVQGAAEGAREAAGYFLQALRYGQLESVRDMLAEPLPGDVSLAKISSKVKAALRDGPEKWEGVRTDAAQVYAGLDKCRVNFIQPAGRNSYRRLGSVTLTRQDEEWRISDPKPLLDELGVR